MRNDAEIHPKSLDGEDDDNIREFFSLFWDYQKSRDSRIVPRREWVTEIISNEKTILLTWRSKRIFKFRRLVVIRIFISLNASDRNSRELDMYSLEEKRNEWCTWKPFAEKLCYIPVINRWRTEQRENCLHLTIDEWSR